MKNFIYKTEVENASAYIQEIICVQAEDREKADYTSRVAMLGWWGVIDSISNNSSELVQSREEGMTYIHSRPKFIDVATDEEVAVIKKFKTGFSTFESDDPIPDLQEAVEYGMNLDHPDVKKGIVDLFGEAVYARLKIEEES